MLDSLPEEILREVLGYIENKADLFAISKSCRRLRIPVFPRIFDALTIKARSESLLCQPKWCPDFTPNEIARISNALSAAKEIHFKAPFGVSEIEDPRTLPMSRCPHILHRRRPDSPFGGSREGGIDDGSFLSPDDGDACSSAQEGDHQTRVIFEFDLLSIDVDLGRLRLRKMGVKIARLLSTLADNQLDAFSWDMGICFPEPIFGERGYLAIHQNRIQKLSLITEPGCLSDPLPLKIFSNLQDFSWVGMISERDCNSLKEFLELHGQKLQSLKICFTDWDRVESFHAIDYDGRLWGTDATPLMELIIPKRKGEWEDILPNLESLSLSGASFKGSFDHLFDAFNLTKVEKLRLVNCQKSYEFLHDQAQKPVALAATKVELTLRAEHEDRMNFAPAEYLALFTDLEDFFFLFESSDRDAAYISRIVSYKDTLRRLVYHRRRHCLVSQSPYFDEYCDGTLDEPDRAEDMKAMNVLGGTMVTGFARIFRETKVECVGVCGEPSQLQRSIQSVASRFYSLKLLHLRFTGKPSVGTTLQRPKFFRESEAPSEYSPPSPKHVESFYTMKKYGSTSPKGVRHPLAAHYHQEWTRIHGDNWQEDERKELEAFADWVFGPDGFPNLQVLASGDFSYGDRFAHTQMLWCRNTRESSSKKNWRVVERSDVVERELIDANKDMLSACPVSPPFYGLGVSDDFPGVY